MATLHDRIFKEFFHCFLPDFVQIFFPEMAAQLNFATLTFVTQELMVNLPQRILRITDVVAEVETWSGEPQAIIVLVEVEANRPAPLPQRMFEYYSLLRLLLQKPVFPIAFLPLHKGGVGWRLYEEELFGRKLGCLHYGQVGLRDLLSPTYLVSENPVAAALAVLMDDPANSASKLKLSALQRVHTSQLTEGDKLYLIEVMETYLPTAMLPQAGDETMAAIATLEETWISKALREGREEGQIIGIKKGREIGLELGREMGLETGREMGLETGREETREAYILRTLTRKFGAISAEITQQIKAQPLATLDTLFDAALDAKQLSDFTDILASLKTD